MSDEKLTSEQRSDLVNYYFERAHESIAEARYLRDGGYLTEQSRAYIMHVLMLLEVYSYLTV